MLKSRLRIVIMQLAFVLIIIVVIARLFYLQVVRHSFFLEKAEAQLKRTITLAAHRGVITDVKGHVYASTDKTISLYAHPYLVKEAGYSSQILSSKLGVSSYEILQKLTQKSPFIWLQRKVPQDLYLKEIKPLKLSGIFGIEEEKRIYPDILRLAHVLGFVGIDNQGLGGLEFAYQRDLIGKPGKIIMESDPFGKEIISGQKVIQSPTHGRNICLTIDDTIQYYTEKILKNAIDANRAHGGSIIVMQPRTGEILAMACSPEFNPNNYLEYPSSIRKNRCVSDIYEPGSTFKVITIAGALEEKIIQPSTVFYCPDTLQIGNRTIKEAHKHQPGDNLNKTVTDILKDSLNIGVAKIGMQLGSTKMEHYIQAFGFGQPTGIQLPAESAGIVRPARTWSESDKGIIPFGQGIAVTPIQMITAISALGNDGIMIKPRIVKSIEGADGQYFKGIPKEEVLRVVSSQTAKEVLQMMVEAVENGTGLAAKIPGYIVAGKTGTAQKVAEGGWGYLENEYVVSFVGLVPVSNPQLAILVIVDQPQINKYGSLIGAPAFHDLAMHCIQYLNIPPDQIADPVFVTSPKERINPDYLTQ